MNANSYQRLVYSDVERVLRRYPPMQSVRHRKSPTSNIWIFDSPKNDKRFSVVGDVAFQHIVLFEGDRDIKSYTLYPDSKPHELNSININLDPDAFIEYTDSTKQWITFSYSSNKKKRSANPDSANSEANGQVISSLNKFKILTDRDLEGRKYEFDNWLLLCAAITRCRGSGTHKEVNTLCKVLDSMHSVTLATLLTLDDIDPAKMLAVIARGLQTGQITTELKNKLFGKLSVISRGKT